MEIVIANIILLYFMYRVSMVPTYPTSSSIVSKFKSTKYNNVRN